MSIAISALPVATTITNTDSFPIVQSGTTKQVTLAVAFSRPLPIGSVTQSTGTFTTVTAANFVGATALFVGASAVLSTNVGAPRFIVGIVGTEPTWTTGSGVPAATEPKGSFYSRTGGGVGTTFYVSQGGGTWNAVAGV